MKALHHHIMTEQPASQPSYTLLRTPATCLSDGVFGFLKGSLCGSVWGIVTPFHPITSSYLQPPPGTSHISTPRLILRYKLPLIAVSMTSNALFLGTILAVFNFSSSTLGYARRRDDWWNYGISAGLTLHFYRVVLASDRRRMIHNRIVGGMVIGAIVYANVFV